MLFSVLVLAAMLTCRTDTKNIGDIREKQLTLFESLGYFLNLLIEFRGNSLSVSEEPDEGPNLLRRTQNLRIVRRETARTRAAAEWQMDSASLPG